MSIRLRLAVVFAVAAAVVFALGSWLFVAELSSSLLSSIDTQLSTRLQQADRYVTSSGSPRSGAGQSAGDYVVQIVDSTGRLRGASAEAEDRLMLSPTQLARARHGRITVTASEEGERQRVSAAPFPSHPGWVAIAGVSLESYDHTLSDVTRELVIGGAVFVVAAGIGAYWLARTALSPVERLRREVAALSEHAPAPGVRVPHTRDEIAALARTMNDLLGRLEHALERQRGLVADASHGLRTPLAVLRGELELAARPGRSRADLSEAVSRATEEVARLARITEQLLFLARSDEDRIPLDRQRVDVADLLTHSAEQAAARANAAGISCRVKAAAGLTAEVDAARIREAVDNLVDNALRFAPAGTAIVIGARAADSSLLIEVGDSGPGFPTEFLPQAFARFARPDSAPVRGESGAGLGLAIVSAIAASHGGKAIASNRPEGGALITLELPGAITPGSH